MKKGFTLIELLAVIVILAIISLIAVPIVINIINDLKEESMKRSVDLYAKALQQSIENYLVNNKEKKVVNIEELHNKNLIEYKGDRVICDVEYINDNGSIYLEKCKVNGVKVKNYTYGIDDRPAVLKLISKSNEIDVTNYLDGNIHEMYTFEHDATEQTPALIDYRYIGDDPYNYVKFNNEIWRIIGVFKVEDKTGNMEYKIKIIRNDRLVKMGYGGAGWALSPITDYLNNEYLQAIDSNFIDDTKYYLGSINGIGNAIEEYALERSGNNNWIGKVAILYVSDYIYNFALGINDVCFFNNSSCINGNYEANPKKSWIALLNTGDKWIINSFTSRYINNGVNTYYTGNMNSNFSIHPTLYLKFELKIKSGDGSKDNPYEFKF